MSQATVTSKGQVTIPKQVRERLGVGPGDRIDFVVEQDGGVRVRRLGRSVADLAGILRSPGRRPVSLRAMDESVAELLARKNERIRKQRG